MAANDVLLLMVAPICYRVLNFYFSVYFMQSAARQCHLYQTVPEQHPWRAKSCKPRDTRMVPKLAEGHLHVMNLGFQAIKTTKSHQPHDSCFPIQPRTTCAFPGPLCPPGSPTRVAKGRGHSLQVTAWHIMVHLQAGWLRSQQTSLSALLVEPESLQEKGQSCSRAAFSTHQLAWDPRNSC